MNKCVARRSRWIGILAWMLAATAYAAPVTLPATELGSSPTTAATTAATAAQASTTRATSTRASTTSAPATNVATTGATTAATTSAAIESRDFLATHEVPGTVVSGDWTIVDGVLRVADCKPKNRAKLRLCPAPDAEYDLTVKFTFDGDRPYFGQIISFEGHQFVYTTFESESAISLVDGKNAHVNQTNVKKKLVKGVHYTSVVKVRRDSVTTYLNDELLCRYEGSSQQLSLWKTWDIGAGDAIGLAAGCAMSIDSIQLTTGIDGAPSTQPDNVATLKDLAAIIADRSTLESAAAATQPAPPPVRRSNAEFLRLVASTQPAVSQIGFALRHARHMVRTPEDSKELLPKPPPEVEALYRRVLVETGRQDPGAGVATTRPARPDPLLEHDSVVDPPPILAAPAYFDGMPAALAGPALLRSQFDLEQARLAIWLQIITRAGEFYPDAKSQRDLVKLQILSPTAAEPVGAFVATNGPADLTNVTLEIELFRANSSDAITRRFCFVEKWPAGQNLFLSTDCVPNVPQAATSKAPSDERSTHAVAEAIEQTPPEDPWLAGVGGVIEARVRVWSDQAIQASQSFHFDTNAEAVAREELSRGYAAVDEFLRRPVAGRASSQPTTRRSLFATGPVVPVLKPMQGNVRPIAIAQECASRALTLVPAMSPVASEARALTLDPQAALRELRKRQLDTFIAAIPPQKAHRGVWAVRGGGVLRALSTAEGRRAIAGQPGDRSGQMILAIDTRTRDGGDITATLTAPDQPTAHRKLIGKLQVDLEGNRLILQLRAAGALSGKAPAESDLKNPTSWSELLLELKDQELIGVATCGVGDGSYTLNVAFDPPDDHAAKPATMKTK